MDALFEIKERNRVDNLWNAWNKVIVETDIYCTNIIKQLNHLNVSDGIKTADNVLN